MATSEQQKLAAIIAKRFRCSGKTATRIVTNFLRQIPKEKANNRFPAVLTPCAIGYPFGAGIRGVVLHETDPANVPDAHLRPLRRSFARGGLLAFTGLDATGRHFEKISLLTRRANKTIGFR